MSSDQQISSDIKTTCPYCHNDLEEDWNYCNECASDIRGLEEMWENETDETLRLYMSSLTSEKLIGWMESREPSFDPNSETDQLIKEKKQSLINTAHDDDSEDQIICQFLLATIGEDWRELEPRSKIGCEVCNEQFDPTHTQEHHVSYLHEITITVCYSCHHRIHHEEGYCDELKPDTTKEEAKKIRETGFDPKSNQ